MYTYDSFVTMGTFTLLRPILITFLVVSVLLFVLILIPKAKKKFINGFSVISLSLLSIWVSAQIIFYQGIIVDELNLGGDSTSFFLFLAITGISCLNLIIYFKRNERTTSV